MSQSFLLAIDQGTTSTRTMVFDAALKPLVIAQREFRQIYPAPGLVEHDPEEIWTITVETMRTAVAEAGVAAKSIAGIGITNQRETTVLWDRATGRPVYNAIVWQDRRTADRCETLREQGLAAMVAEKSGLLIDPYFSATKIAWILEHVEGARAAAEAGRLAFGTIDTFLLWRLTGGRVHATDATNAARTLLFNIKEGRWDAELLSLFDIPHSLLPEVRDCAADFGTTEPGFLGTAVPIRGMTGDQQAAAIGQGCFHPGMTKATYGTGCFTLLNTGLEPVVSRNRLLTTVAYQLDGRRTFALEGAIFVAGAAVQWLRDCLGVVARADETDALAFSAHPDEEVYLVPAFVGLGAPWWDANARGAIYGLTRNSGRAEFARAALEAVGYQTRDLLAAMHADWQAQDGSTPVLRVDGGLSASNYAMQFLADMMAAPVDRAVMKETTALGAAYLAGRCAGVCPDIDEFGRSWRAERRFMPQMEESHRARKWRGWQEAVGRVVGRDRG